MSNLPKQAALAGAERGLARREFLALSAASAAALVSGCATNPVSGRKQMMFVTPAEEIAMDQKASPQQFSADYGVVQDAELNAYLSGVGRSLAAVSHRPQMPFSFRAVNAVAVNAYTFPGGSVAVNRGLLLELQNESQLAGVVGHEIGHVCARHTSSQMSKGMLATAAVSGLAAYMQLENEKYADLAAGLGGLGANVLLARYSRSDERQADELGMEYSAKAGQNPAGMAQVMEVFLKLQTSEPSAVELLFATHPMSSERLDTALRRLRTQYADVSNRDPYRERYMDRTAKVRAIGGAIKAMQKAEERMMAGKHREAEAQLKTALEQAPDDYAGLVLMSKCLLAQNRNAEAEQYASRAKASYPQEAQAKHLRGMALLQNGKYEAARAEFREYERVLPGNPNTIFFEGLCSEGMGQRRDAAQSYYRYSQMAPNGAFSRHAVQRLNQWKGSR